MMSEKQPGVAIFLAKNWLGMSDKQDIEHSTKDGKPLTSVIFQTINSGTKTVTEQLMSGEVK